MDFDKSFEFALKFMILLKIWLFKLKMIFVNVGETFSAITCKKNNRFKRLELFKLIKKMVFLFRE